MTGEGYVPAQANITPETELLHGEEFAEPAQATENMGWTERKLLEAEERMLSKLLGGRPIHQVDPELICIARDTGRSLEADRLAQRALMRQRRAANVNSTRAQFALS